MPDPKTKEDYKKDLLDNIAFIQSFAPDFKMTDEQIESMLTDDKIRMHQKYKGQNPVQNGSAREAIVGKYTPSYHSAFERHARWIIKDDDTPEGKEYNKKLLNNLGRDDELGLKAQEEYLAEMLNSVGETDISKFDENVPFEEFMDYAEKMSYYGKAIMECQHGIAQFTQATIKNGSQEKIKAVYDYGSSAGAVLGSAVEVVGNEGFLTLPIEFLSDKQYDLLLKNIYKDPERLAKFGATFPAVMKSWASNKKEIKQDYEKYRQHVNEGEKISFDDVFSYVKPKETIVSGGYLKRRDSVLDSINEIQSKIEEAMPGTQSHKNIVDQGNALREMIENLGDKVPDAEEQQALATQAKKYSKAIYDFRKTNEVTKSPDPKIKGLEQYLTEVTGNALIGYTNPKALKSNVHYYAEDLQKAAQADIDTNRADYIKEAEFLAKQLKKTEGNWTANSPQYDIFSKKLKDLPGELSKLKDAKEINFEKFQELFKPVVDAANEYIKSHKNIKLNSRQFRRIKIMNRLKDLSQDAVKKNNAPGKDINYRLAEKIYTAYAIKNKNKNAMIDDNVREQGIKNIMNSKRFKRDFVNAPQDVKEKLLKISGEKVLDGMMEQYAKENKLAKTQNAAVKQNVDPLVLG